MSMSFLINTPEKLLEKLFLDLQDFNSDCNSSRNAINFCLTAYHLREWIWKFYFRENHCNQLKIFQKEISEEDFNREINLLLPRFKLIKDITNGAKHFDIDHKTDIKNTDVDVTVTWDQDDSIWNNDECPWDYSGCRIHLKDGTIVSCQTLFQEVYDFWNTLIDKIIKLQAPNY
jgi:hypothetical protein